MAGTKSIGEIIREYQRSIRTMPVQDALFIADLIEQLREYIDFDLSKETEEDIEKALELLREIPTRKGEI